MCHVHPPLWAFFRLKEIFSKSQSEGGPFRLSHIFSSSPRPWCLASGLCSGVFSVPGIYVETYVYDDVYVSVLMTSYFRASDHRLLR